VDRPVFFSDFVSVRPKHAIAQADSLAWLAAAHAMADGGERRKYDALFARYGCGPDRVASRGHELEDFSAFDWSQNRIFRLHEQPKGAGFAARTDFFAEAAERFFGEAYPPDAEAPAHLIHVTCTGYVSPSAAQLLVARRGWRTIVTHAYHMGCAGAFPAVRLASAFAKPGTRVDVVHTELCSLHLDPSEHSPEQLVAQGLFADGCIRYSASAERPDSPSLQLIALRERIVPDTEDAMTWRPGETAMRMTLAKRMPLLVREHIRPFVEGLFEEAGLPKGAIAQGAAFAVHPGGPKIIDAAREALGLSESQVEWSRRVLHDYGNMSSATIPHVWKRIAEDSSVPPGTLVPSVAFGPGLTVSGAIFRKP
jgi:predicted naringenin-chalcone synthase